MSDTVQSNVKYDAAECERLEREAREDADAFVGDDAVAWHAACGRHHNNARAMADQLAAARAEIERLTAERDLGNRMLADAAPEHTRMRKVVEAACELVDNWRDDSDEEIGGERLEATVDAYRAARDKAGT